MHSLLQLTEAPRRATLYNNQRQVPSRRFPSLIQTVPIAGGSLNSLFVVLCIRKWYPWAYSGEGLQERQMGWNEMVHKKIGMGTFWISDGYQLDGDFQRWELSGLAMGTD